MDRMDPKRKAELRTKYYFEIEGVLESLGVDFEPVVGGLLVRDPSGANLVLNVTVKDEGKFDLDAERAAYAEKIAKKAARDQEAAVKAVARAEASANKAQQVNAGRDEYRTHVVREETN